jgi:hypothetical protein
MVRLDICGAEFPLRKSRYEKRRDRNEYSSTPEICRFLGIVISMYFDEHNPPHFHVRYNEYRAVFSIRTLNMRRRTHACARGLVEEWAELHQSELMSM